MSRINLSDIVRTVRQLATENPDAVYGIGGPCYYTRGECGDGVGCLVGQAIQKVAPDLHPFLLMIDGKSSISITLLVRNNPDIFFLCSENDLYWLGLVQGYQDQQKSWKEAVLLADKGFV